ncbi:hypothetical protein HaLaN_23163, partial [Haematococcus lacustris]
MHGNALASIAPNPIWYITEPPSAMSSITGGKLHQEAEDKLLQEQLQKYIRAKALKTVGTGAVKTQNGSCPSEPGPPLVQPATQQSHELAQEYDPEDDASEDDERKYEYEGRKTLKARSQALVE